MVIEAAGGGTARHVVDLATGLDQRGHEITIAYSDRRNEPHDLASLREATGCAIVRVDIGRKPGPLDMASVASVRRYIATNGPFEVVHGHSVKGGVIARLAAPRSCARIYTPHSLPTRETTASTTMTAAYHVAERALARTRTDAVIAVSGREAIRARAFGVPPGIIHVVPNGIAGPAPVSRRQARRTLGVDDSARVVGFVGRLCTQKDPLRFIEVVARCRAHHPDVVGVVVGYGELETSLLARSKELGVADCVRLVHHDRAGTLMSGFDVYCLTSRVEGMPYTLLEALSCGVPVVATDVGGVSELVTHGRNGYVVPVAAGAEDLASRIGTLLTSRSLRDSAAKWSREVSAFYSVDRMVASTYAVYERVRARQRQPT